MIDFTVGVKVKQYGCRTARVVQSLLILRRDECIEFENELALEANDQPDNHTVYELSRGENKLYIMFSDQNVLVGTSVEEK